MNYVRKSDIKEKYDNQSWQRVVFSELEAAILSNSRPYPCIYGVTGFRTDNLRFAFLEKIDAASLAPVLEEYLAEAPTHGRHASLIVFERPTNVEAIETYEDRFWTLLNGLTTFHKEAWPHNIPTEIDHPRWEFCFAGEPIFVVCNTPGHVSRQSRRSTGFMLTFQPRWVFEGITDTERSANAAFTAVRQRLISYDLVQPSPALGRYGDEDVREYAQYFLHDDNSIAVCPLRQLSNPTTSGTLMSCPVGETK